MIQVGGATGLIGDPSGRSSERNLLSIEQVAANKVGIQADLQRVLASDRMDLVDNADWYNGMSVVDFLRDVGKHFRVSAMLAKDSVRSRLESDQGISFTEFTYQVLQGYDFFHLHRQHGCSIQMGGSDQWGNITAGIDLISRVTGKHEVFGLTTPLLTTATGEKFGKSAGNAIWLNPKRTSPFKMYQYLLNTADADVVRLLHLLTFRSLNEIDDAKRTHEASKEERLAQRLLAADVTRIVHGQTGLDHALKATDVFFGRQSLHTVQASELLDIFDEMPHYKLPKSLITSSTGLTLAELMVLAKVSSSKGTDSRLRFLIWCFGFEVCLCLQTALFELLIVICDLRFIK